jgi:hypothetical protein
VEPLTEGFLITDDAGHLVPTDDPNQSPQFLVVDTPPQAVTSGNWPEGWAEVGTAPPGGGVDPQGGPPA